MHTNIQPAAHVHLCQLDSPRQKKDNEIMTKGTNAYVLMLNPRRSFKQLKFAVTLLLTRSSEALVSPNEMKRKTNVSCERASASSLSFTSSSLFKMVSSSLKDKHVSSFPSNDRHEQPTAH